MLHASLCADWDAAVKHFERKRDVSSEHQQIILAARPFFGGGCWSDYPEAS